ARLRAGLLALASTSLIGCAGEPSFRTAADLGSERRKPDGVAIDPASSPPAAIDRADSAAGLVTLRAPLGVDRAILTLNELVRVILVEDSDALDTLFTRDALAVTTLAANAGPGQTPSATLWWKQRFHRLDYTRLAGETILREAEMQIFRAGDALDSPPHPAIRLDALGEGDVVIRVPVVTSRLGADRFFGDELIVWLRRDGSRYRIYRILEDFQLS
ncbi:MAG: hypothetical protein U0359_42090, partial [Byssovorax sp.]